MSGQADYVFLHGGGQGSWVWAQTIEALGRQTGGGFGRALALDVPGCGVKRGRPTSDLSMEDIARELIGDIEAAGLSDVVLVGHSQGGQALGAMAGLGPGLFRRLVYVACSIPLPGQTVLRMMGESVHGTSPEEVGWPCDPKRTPVEERFPLMFCNDMTPEETARLMQEIGRDNWPPRTYAMTDWRYPAEGDPPATYVVCLKDNSVPAAWQEAFAARFGAERVVRIDAGHQAMITRPHALAEILRKEAER